jgi:signal transduction histidine kinase
VAAAWAGVLLYLAWRYLPRYGHGVSEDPLLVPLLAGAGLACLARARASQGREVLGWKLVAWAWLSSAAGMVIYAAGRAAPRDLAHLLYNVYYPLMLVGLWRLTRLPRDGTGRARLGLEVGVVVSATLAVVWYASRPAGPGPLLPALDWRVAALAGGEVATMAAAATLLFGLPLAAGGGLRLLGLAAFGGAVADLVGFRAMVAPSPLLAAASDAVVALAAALVLTAALLPEGPARPGARGPGTDLLVRAFAQLPFLAGTGLFGALLWELWQGDRRVALVLALAAALTTVLALVRLALEQRALDAELTLRAHDEELRLRGQQLQALGQLAGSLAHDLNNLLVVVLGSGSAMRQRAPGPDADDLLQAAERGAVLCRQILDFGRRVPATSGLVDLRLLADRLAPMLRRLIRPRVELLVEGEPGRALVRADPVPLEVALLNLATNGRDAMPDGGTLEVRAGILEVAAGDPWFRQGVHAGRWALLSVRDFGRGMDAETLRRVGEPFFTTKAPGKGTGLGLASVRATARAAGGRLVVASTPGQGTTVSLVLPAVLGPG